METDSFKTAAVNRRFVNSNHLNQIYLKKELLTEVVANFIVKLYGCIYMKFHGQAKIATV